jgi:hypothetical protein
MENQEERVGQLLTPREKQIEEFIHVFFDELERDNKFDGLAADVAQELRYTLAFQKLSDHSLVLGHRLESLIKHVISQRENNQLRHLYGKIMATKPNQEFSARAYKKCFNGFVDDETSVSYKAGDPLLIGTLSCKDAFILTYWSFVTMGRSKSDNIMQLIVCGKNSTGNMAQLAPKYLFCSS